MLSKSHITMFVAAAVAGFGVAANAYSDMITYVGSVTDTSSTAGQVTSWRASTVVKTLQVNGSNVYGSSLGAVIWNIGSTGEQSAGTSTTLGWHYVGSGYQGHNGYTTATIDNLTSGTTTAGVCVNSFVFQLTGTQADYTGKVVRVGVMENIFVTDASHDTGKSLTLTGPNSSTSGPVAVAATNGVPNMYFFDITGITAGDQFTITAPNSTTAGNTTSAAEGYLSAVSWDIADASAVPEPATLSLFAVAAIGLLATRRKVSTRS
ncbi:MAG: PEP-CTERM sorting domain-containing protein [Phycisphaerae bacterium]|nr:PEP-CTERM sorting domain-containing protein [Phycisphaerae bacterium]